MPLNITRGKNKESYRCTADNGVGNPLTKDVIVNTLCECLIVVMETGAYCIDQTRGTAADES